MTIYNFNLGIGWASSGVEYAQVYRAKNFRAINQDAKFIFTDLILGENIAHFTQKIGFKNSEVIWLYTYFTDLKISETTYTIDDVENSIGIKPSNVEKNGSIIRLYYKENDMFLTAYLKDENSNIVNRVEYVSRGMLIRKDYFTYTRMCSEYYTPKNNAAHLYQRKFFNEDGSVAYEEIIDGDNIVYKFPDKIMYSKYEFIKYFVEKLNFTKNDVVIIDRSTGQAQAILENKKDAKVGVVIHAEHFSENSTDDNNILWNNYYEYQFNYSDYIDFFITATDAQKNLLEEQFRKYYNKNIVVYTVPVGSIENLQYTEEKRKPYSLITASRLASEKHIDWLIQAVVDAKQKLPNLTFDIYGSGGEQGKLVDKISENNAEDYIKLRGHKDLTDIYKNYEMYITASTSEGFGLTLLEAIGSGLPIIGFDVRYGNQTFITPDENGYLIEYDQENIRSGIEAITNKIISIYENNSLDEFRENSYKNAKKFLTKEVEKQWLKLLNEVVGI
ncbi:accessory Sec system glycosyltransferase GtfA [Gemella sp. GH3]|uniref:accessory Sec system glycosyltransferase GtfA n=1 Tax=unclassified Gemella TaxID=2624949 RepID=UPI0015D03805|nr:MULTISPECIES: accessory Sec system glycosyltransferase GtfA [unclassified Gemella]MBF0714047.1 accessory Sec system glycosyltransferase GtfA [Gemella sp. GH3.1]NYS50999.1 accessory Sec system glycosyltransferase GtfA [Gemella sp. GH3]